MFPTPEYTEKAALRRQLRARRQSIATSPRRAASTAVVRLALRYRLLAKGRRVGIYMPAKSEIDVRPLLDRARAMQARCFLPIVPGRGHKRMWFSQLGEHPAWVLNRYGIPEYRHPTAKRVRVQRLDLLFLPLLGFDSRGFRLGMGGGYYDASLANLKRFRRWRRPRIIGVAFSVQEVDRVPNDPWDIPLDAVLTEQEYRVFRAT
ncbi:MAG: 5-formyltetrahydrofolate cyclo-ligase [Gallionellaceae bacterium]|nr:5-formyltetrahydrofolate cyclo-ligase [Gallionellaceae bacterium]